MENINEKYQNLRERYQDLKKRFREGLEILKWTDDTLGKCLLKIEMAKEEINRLEEENETLKQKLKVVYKI